MMTEEVAEQPFELSVTVRLYVPDLVTIGFGTLALFEEISGPFQQYTWRDIQTLNTSHRL